jgi:PAS domain S-box-containing protein
MDIRIRAFDPLIKLDSRVSTLTTAVLTTFLCYFAAEIGGVLVVRPQMLWPLWPGCALLVALLLLTPTKRWPVLIIAGFAGFVLNDLLAFGLSVRQSGILIVADTIEVLVAAMGIRFMGDIVRLNSISSFSKYFLVAVILAPISAAFVSATAFQGHYWTFWAIAVLTEGLALLTATPAILGVVRAVMRRRESRASYIESTAIMVALVVLGYITFISAGVGHPELLYSLVPFLLWSALRVGVTGTSISVIVVAFLSIWGAIHGHGPFVGREKISDVMSLQLFLLFAATPFMFLAALVEERKLAEETVRESEARFRLVANTAPVMIWMSGLDTRPTYFNQFWLDFTGLSEAELKNGLAGIIHPEDYPQCHETYCRGFDQRQPFRKECRVRRHDGQYRWMIDIGVPRFHKDGSFAGYIGSCVDVTDRKLAEDALASTGRKLIEAHEEERTRIARELHDDVCQRLALLAVGIDQVRQRGDELPPEVRNQVAELKSQTTSLANDVQTMSHTLHSSKIEILGLVAAMKSVCQEFGQQYKMVIDFASQGSQTSVPPQISLGLFRVLQEALRNASKHSGVKRVEVQLRESKNEIHLRVSDSGRGFDLNSAMQSRGLGLTSMQERIRLLNGTITIQSEPMGGTAIYVRVPFRSGYDSQRIAG